MDLYNFLFLGKVLFLFKEINPLNELCVKKPSYGSGKSKFDQLAQSIPKH